MHVASAHGQSFEKIDLRENKWNKYLTNYNKQINKLFGITVYSGDPIAFVCEYVNMSLYPCAQFTIHQKREKLQFHEL